MPKLRVGVIFGGRSGEHEVSLTSARAILEHLDRRKYEVVPIGITKQGEWLLGSGEAASILPAAVFAAGRPLLLPPQPRAMTSAPAAGRHASALKLDVVFPILHGTFGEDGTIQGFLELAEIPYVGSGVLGSAASMDKDAMKRLFLQAGLPVLPWRTILRRDWEANPGSVLNLLRRHLRYPIFVKPANLGSSVGISKAHDQAELAPALDLASRFDSKLVVEQGIEAREIECSVLGNEEPRASLPGEIIPGREFYDYQAKYLDDDSRCLIPAPLNARQTRNIQKMAAAAFRATECAGLARVDFLMQKEKPGRIYVNEVNSMPGFTPISMYPKLWAASGLPMQPLLDRLIELALERARDRARNSYDRQV